MIENKVATIPIENIQPSKILLRQVDCSSLDYKELVESIRDVGILNSLSVRPNPKHKGIYDLVDGHHRFSAALDLRLTTVPCIILPDVDVDTEVIRRQLQANFCGHRTSFSEAAKGIRLILMANPNMTFEELSHLLHKRVTWIRNCLALQRLIELAKQHLNRGELRVGSAILLSKLPAHMQEDLLPFALTMAAGDFRRRFETASKAYREARSQETLIQYFSGNQDSPEPWLRNMKEIQYEIEFGTAGALFIAKHENLTPLEIWRAALAWLLHIDEESIRAFKAKHDRTEVDRAASFLDRKAARNLLRRIKEKGLVVPQHLEDAFLS